MFDKILILLVVATTLFVTVEETQNVMAAFSAAPSTSAVFAIMVFAALLLWQALAFGIACLPKDHYSSGAIAVAVLSAATLTCLHLTPAAQVVDLTKLTVRLYLVGFVIGRTYYFERHRAKTRQGQ